MKDNVTYVDSAEFEKIRQALGIPAKENAGFIQWILGNGYHLYVAKTKRVGRVDFQFLPPEGETGARVLGEGERFGRIVAQLDFSPELRTDILEAFERMVRHGMGLPTWERPKRQAISSTKPLPVSSSPVEDMTEEEVREALEVARQKRRELIEKVAGEKGVDISPDANL